MDFQGQKQAEQLIYRLLVVFAVAGFVAGYVLSSFDLMVYINAAGLGLTVLLVVPNWPFFNRNPLNWLPPLNPEDSAAAGQGSSSSTGGGAPTPARAVSAGGAGKR
jgi:signal peptidase complex subunit 1